MLASSAFARRCLRHAPAIPHHDRIWLAAAAMFVPMLAAAQSPETLERATRLDAEAFELYRQGRYADAVPKARESLALREQALGPDHPDLSVSLGELRRAPSGNG